MLFMYMLLGLSGCSDYSRTWRIDSTNSWRSSDYKEKEEYMGFLVWRVWLQQPRRPRSRWCTKGIFLDLLWISPFIKFFIMQTTALRVVLKSKNRRDMIQMFFIDSRFDKFSFLKVEFARFRAMLRRARPSHEHSAIEWWASNYDELPHIGRIARTYFLIPSSSVDCERTFRYLICLWN